MTITAQDVRDAAARIAGYVARTPLLGNPRLDAATGAVIRFKAEPLQYTGSFKVRGAFNRLLRIAPADRRRGVVAFSSGNHGQAVAFAARRLGMDAVIVMPADAPRVKREATRAHGATIRAFDRAHEDREAIAAEIAERDGRILVPSYDDADVMAGQGTLGLEAVRQLADESRVPDLLVSPVGGGGLLSGAATAVRDAAPECEVVGVEPAGFDDHARSRAAGMRVGNASGATSLCDALLSPMPGALTWPVHQRCVDAYAVVDDAAVCAAMRWAFTHLKLVLEPGGAVALAEVLARGERLAGRTVVVVLSGGNVDAELHARCLASAEDRVAD